QHRDKLETLAQALAEREILEEREIEVLIGPASNRAQTNGKGTPAVIAPGPAPGKAPEALA
ncbi:MAG TPA: hypothetical protein VHY20_07135, partial [Pirellulales bacterium]|nr:hypothetical protein [Pirellulales bacterium]